MCCKPIFVAYINRFLLYYTFFIIFLSVTLTGSEPFRGVLLQARVVGSDSPIGTWQIDSNEPFRVTRCGGIPNSLTHRSNDDKTLPRRVYWRAPITLRGDVQFM